MLEMIKGWHFPAAVGIVFIVGIMAILTTNLGQSFAAYTFDMPDLGCALIMMLLPFAMGILAGLYHD